ncbi:hypothetical protein ACSBR2_035378 [Camellia fascicularis]
MDDRATVAIGGGASLIRNLASCNKTTRDRALKLLLKSWLPSQKPNQVSDDDMKKLWKGLFYCVWHADKAPVQSDLIDRLSSLLLTLDLPLSLHYLSVFFLTMRREWTGIDSLRLDKFYLLIRRFIHCSFLLLKNNCYWDLEHSRRLMGVFEDKLFFADDKFLGNGVNYHIASIFLEELEGFLPIRSETLDVIFKPFLLVMSKCQDKVLLGKVKCNMFDELLKLGRSLLELKKLGAADSGNDRVVALGTIALTMGFSAKFYDLGSAPDCLQGNRKVLFGLHEVFLRLEKDLALSGIEISIPDVVDGEDEVPTLIPIVTETELTASEVVLEPTEIPSEDANGSASKLLKKNKKVKKASDRSNDKAMKKKKKKRLSEQCPAEVEEGSAIIANGESFSNETASDETNLIFNESVISNLQMQFEKVAAEIALDKDDLSSYDSPENTIKTIISKKRKRVKSKDGQDTRNQGPISEENAGCDAAAMSMEKSAKKVRFSMKNNLVWKPHNPLPPQSLRLPPSVTPRGSALKKGIPPGPIKEMLPLTKRVKQKKKKGRKGIKTISPAIKRLRKLQTLSI